MGHGARRRPDAFRRDTGGKADLDDLVADRLGEGFTAAYTPGSGTTVTVSITETNEAMGVFAIVSTVARGLNAEVTMGTEPRGSA